MIRTYQGADLSWIATDDADHKASGASAAEAVAQFRADYPDAAQASDEADARAAAERAEHERRRKMAPLKTQLGQQRQAIERDLAATEQRASQLRAALLKTIGGLEAIGQLEQADQPEDTPHGS